MVDPRILAVGVGVALASSAVALQRNPRRVLGLVPFACTGLVVVLTWLACFGESVGTWFFLTLTFCLAVLPLLRHALFRPPYRGPGTLTVAALAILLSFFSLPMPEDASSPIPWDRHALFTLVAAAIAWVTLFPQAIEQALEIALWPIYRIRVHGPGAGRISRYGPLLIVANHSSYIDPLWVGKIVPRHLTPLMTSYFYDRPIIRWLMVHAVGTIRVAESPVRKQAPELTEAVAVLRQGGCVLLFPEGYLRRTEESLLRAFGQGAWHILKELPETPVVTLWIEGGWGSYASYKDGPPFKNKRFDWWRRIDIAVEEPRPLPAEALVDHRATRLHLLRAVAKCRRHLGLPVPNDTGRLPTCDAPPPPVE